MHRAEFSVTQRLLACCNDDREWKRPQVSLLSPVRLREAA